MTDYEFFDSLCDFVSGIKISRKDGCELCPVRSECTVERNERIKVKLEKDLI